MPFIFDTDHSLMKHTSHSIASRSPVAMRRIVSAIAAGMLGLAASTFSTQVLAQTRDVLADKIEAEESKTEYVLPKQKLTYEITAYQILSDLALTRGELPPGSWEALTAATRPDATLGVALIEQMALANILKKSETGQLQSAYDDTQAFLKKHPKHEVGLTLLGDLAGKLGYTDDQLHAFEQLYALTPNDAEAMNNLGYYLIDHNIRLNEAEKLIKRALKISPNAPHIIDSAAWLAYRQGKLAQAVQLSRTAVAAQPSPDVRLHLAEILWVSNGAGERDEARQLFTQLKTEIDAKDTMLIKQFNETTRRLGVDAVPVTAP